MGLSGGSKSLSGSAQKWAQPFAQQAARDVQSVFGQNQSQLGQITKGITDLLPGMSETFSGWQPSTQASQGYFGDVLSGKYLDPGNNPGLESVLGRVRRDVTDDVNSQFATAGRYGSGAHTNVLSRNLAEAEGGILADQYNRERAMMDSAASGAPQLQMGQLEELLKAAGVGAELPYTGTNNLASSLSALFSGGTQKQSAGIGGILSGVGSAMSGAAALSDRRLKQNIEKVGEFADGLGIYDFDYATAPGELRPYMAEGRQRGVMADEVEILRPWALGPEVAGFKTVNYAAL